MIGNFLPTCGARKMEDERRHAVEKEAAAPFHPGWPLLKGAQTQGAFRDVLMSVAAILAAHRGGRIAARTNEQAWQSAASMLSHRCTQ